ncbi:head GIN domain-containing protein [Sphingomonas sp. LHG3443-2]|uniref:head GIN domain-containing protein n=1 Tax=Sphingomonas sp. LHG3443-2 TaxID=2804639 RepID=UPI003CE9C691
MRQQLLLATAALSALALPACSVGRAESAGPSVSRNYDVGAFTGLEVAGPFDVKVATGKAVSVSATGPQKLLDETEVVVKDGKLTIGPKKKNWFGGMSWGSREPSTFTITVPSLEQAAVRGSGDIDVDRVTGHQFKGSIAGSGNLRLAAVAVQELGLSIAGSGEITAAGQAQRASYTIAGSGDLDASGVRTVDAAASIAGSGDIKAQATGTAQAKISGSGDIAVTGGARCQTSKNGSGNIRCS